MGGNKETLVPHLVATLIYLSQIYLYYIRGDRSPLKIINIIIITIIIKKGILIYIHVLSCQGLQCGYNDLDLVLQSKQGGWGLIWKQTVKFQHWYGSSDIYTFLSQISVEVHMGWDVAWWMGCCVSRRCGIIHTSSQVGIAGVWKYIFLYRRPIICNYTYLVLYTSFFILK